MIAAATGERDLGGLVARLDPRTRIVLAVIVTIGVIALTSPAHLVVALALTTALVLATRLPPRYVTTRVLLLEGLLLMVVLTLPFSVPGETLWALGPLNASDAGVERALGVFLRANTVALTLLALVATLPVPAIARALEQLRVPTTLVQTLLFTFRYVSVIQQEFMRLRRSMLARGFAPSSDRQTYRSYGCFIGALVVRSVERSERILNAMRCRGFDGRFPTQTVTSPLPRGDLALLALATLALVGGLATAMLRA